LTRLIAAVPIFLHVLAFPVTLRLVS